MEKFNEITDYPKLIIGKKELVVPIILGGMGVGVSMAGLAAAVANEGGAGTLPAVCLSGIWSQRLGFPVSAYDAVSAEIALARVLSPKGVIGINVMVAVLQDYEDSIRAAVASDIDYISIGAGLIKYLPVIKEAHQTPILVIVSSDRAAKIAIHRFKKNEWPEQGYYLAGLIVEGPKAGGHLGFEIDEIDKDEFQLEAILPKVIEIAKANGNIPVIAAGGIFTREDILYFLDLEVQGVQIATRFLGAKGVGIPKAYTEAVLATTEPGDIIVVLGSPCNMPFRVLKSSPMYQSFLKGEHKIHCNMGYLLRKDDNEEYTKCFAKDDRDNFFCICNGLSAAYGMKPTEEPIFTGGANTHRVRESFVKEIMDEYKGIAPS